MTKWMFETFELKSFHFKFPKQMDRCFQPDLMKVRIYGTNVISRGIYTPKTVFACIWHAIFAYI